MGACLRGHCLCAGTDDIDYIENHASRASFRCSDASLPYSAAANPDRATDFCSTRLFGKNRPWRSAAPQHSLLCMLVTCCGRYLAELVCSTYCAARKQSRGHPAQILRRDGIVCDDVEGRELPGYAL